MKTNYNIIDGPLASCSLAEIKLEDLNTKNPHGFLLSSPSGSYFYELTPDNTLKYIL